jgi:hypothetical protein
LRVRLRNSLLVFIFISGSRSATLDFTVDLGYQGCAHPVFN